MNQDEEGFRTARPYDPSDPPSIGEWVQLAPASPAAAADIQPSASRAGSNGIAAAALANEHITLIHKNGVPVSPPAGEAPLPAAVSTAPADTLFPPLAGPAVPDTNFTMPLPQGPNPILVGLVTFIIVILGAGVLVLLSNLSSGGGSSPQPSAIASVAALPEPAADLASPAPSPSATSATEEAAAPPPGPAPTTP